MGGVDFNSLDNPSCLFEIVSMQHCVNVNQYNTTLSGCDTPFPHVGGAAATLVWHCLLYTSDAADE